MIQGNRINIREKDLYVEVYGAEDQDAILYLHGGPGESCYDFSFEQAEKLGENFYVVSIDQRGVCRSEEIHSGEEFSLKDIIEDCETLREHLNIRRWSLIGHSFGGFLSVMYASQYPDSIEKIIFEGPTFDFELTSRNLLRKTALLLEESGKYEEAGKCRKLADTKESVSIRELTEKYMAYSDLLGGERMKIYKHDIDSGVDYSFYSDEEWETFYDRSDIHYNLLREEGKIFDSLLAELKALPHDMLLLMGDSDPVPCPIQIAVFNETKNGRIYRFKDCGHTPHYESPQEFTRVVTQFLTKQKTALIDK
ncbi:alpha/beta fold hydrolase [Rossellomorea aquimaris]|uniref:Alpha/beta hydrolase n=1 Tax=Rossellomorea aquimaris TaxID=189382 RepID=A0A5D4U6G4_9BACI|nr:alpha/beta hydrolase [Rossellomorea aquimaris]TYS82877.1 alpha/beta hydrolase [Rossellomorea aquimaris]